MARAGKNMLMGGTLGFGTMIHAVIETLLMKNKIDKTSVSSKKPSYAGRTGSFAQNQRKQRKIGRDRRFKRI